MERAYILINRSEELYNRKKTVKRGLNFLFRCYEAYFSFRDFKTLNRGYVSAKKIFGENRQSVSLALTYALFAAVKGNINEAEGVLYAVEGRLKFLRANDGESYAFYYYVKGLKEIFKDNISGCLDCAKALEQCDTLFSDVFLADIYIFMLADYGKTEDCLKAAYDKGNRSRIFFGVLKKFYGFKKDNDSRSSFDGLLIPLFRWGCAREADISEIVEANAEKISLKGFESLRLCFKLYKIYSGRNIVIQIIRVLMNNFDYSRQAYYIYNDAVKKQIELPGLIDFFIITSFRLGVEKMGVYPVKKYLSSENTSKEVKAFLYHIILNNGKYSRLLKAYENEIIRYGLEAFSEGIKGRYYYSIYKYITDNREKYRLPSEIYDGMLKLLADIAFCYEVETDNGKTAFVRIKQRDNVKMLSYPVKNSRAYIYSAGDSFSVYSFDFENREILTGSITKKRLIGNIDPAFCMRIYEKGFADESCLVYLGKYFSTAENDSPQAVEILSRAAAVRGIARSLKIRINFRLGYIYYKKGEKAKALELFNSLDVNLLNDKSTETLVKIYTEEETASAVSVIVKKSYAITDKTLFNAVRKAVRDKKYADISPLAYELLLKGHYDALFVEIVDKSYSGSLREWMELGLALNEMGVPDRRIDERILRQSIFAHSLDGNIEAVFSNIYHNAPESEITEPFTAFVCCLVLTENISISRETVQILENEFINSGSEVIGAALSKIYINQGVTTERFYDIIEKIKNIFEEKKINMPWFSAENNKIFHSPYIDKNTAFCYKGSKDKEVYMFYRRGSRGGFLKSKMKYFKFGLYISCLNVFYGERIEYYFSRQLENGSIETPVCVYASENKNTLPDGDDFFEINDAFYNRSMAKYNLVEKYLSARNKPQELIIGRLL